MGNIKLYLGLAIGVLIFCSLTINVLTWINKKIANKAARYILSVILLAALLWLFLFMYGDNARLVIRRF